MIHDVLKILKDEANNCWPNDENPIEIEDITKSDSDTEGVSDKVILTLLNTEEEPTLKNNPNYKVNKDTGKAIYENRSAHLNLYIMFAANKSTYTKSLQDISVIIEFFKSKSYLFKTEEADGSIKTNLNETTSTDLQEFNFKINLHPLPFEQLSYVWGVLGGKVMPSALYKISIIKLQKTDNTKEGGVIKTINHPTTHLNPTV